MMMARSLGFPEGLLLSFALSQSVRLKDEKCASTETPCHVIASKKVNERSVCYGFSSFLSLDHQEEVEVDFR